MRNATFNEEEFFLGKKANITDKLLKVSNEEYESFLRSIKDARTKQLKMAQPRLSQTDSDNLEEDSHSGCLWQENLEEERTIVRPSPVMETNRLYNKGTRGGYITPTSIALPPPAALIALY